jgi:hypothetical protein
MKKPIFKMALHAAANSLVSFINSWQPLTTVLLLSINVID